jgi:hypothetical protein
MEFTFKNHNVKINSFFYQPNCSQTGLKESYLSDDLTITDADGNDASNFDANFSDAEFTEFMSKIEETIRYYLHYYYK